MRGKRRRHPLHDVAQVVQVRLDDRFAEGLEAAHVERDVVVDQEDDLRAVIARVGDVGDHASHLAGVEVPAAHLDDRAEAAVERAPARGLDHVHRIAEERVPLQHARGPSRDGERLVEPMRGRACVVVDDGAVGGPPGEPGDCGKRVAIGGAPAEPAHRCSRRFRARAAVRGTWPPLPRGPRSRRRRRRSRPRWPGSDRTHRRPGDARGHQHPQPADEPERGPPLEGHAGQADDVGPMLANEPLDGREDVAGDEHEVGNRHTVMGIDVAGQRREGAVRHAHADRRCVLERVRHREEQHVHQCASQNG